MASIPPISNAPSRPARRSRESASDGPARTGPSTGPGSISRIPPHSFEAEESLLGAMLLSRDAIAVAVEEVSADDFYKPSHAHIFGAVTALYARGEPADAVTVAEEMRRRGSLDASGGASTLMSLQANTPAISSASRYGRIVQENAVLRRLIGVAYEIAEIGYELPTDVVAALDRAEAMVFEVAQRRSNDSTRALKDLLAESLDHLEYLDNRGETITGVATGYTDLDHQLYGLQPSNLIVVGARPSMGKTAFALGLASHAARIGVPVLFFSLEMSHLELAQRVLCTESRVDAGRLRNGKLVESDWSKIAGAIGRIGTSPLYIDDNPNVTVMDIRAKARRMKSAEGGLGLVVVDYLQLMTGRTSAESRQVEISEISRGLKILARELQIPVVALSQLSRNLESRADKRPMLSDLRECLSGATKVTRADSNQEVTLAELAHSGAKSVPVWSLDERYRLVRATMTEVWSTGTKPVFDIRLSSGRSLRLTANHPLLTLAGWVPAGDLAPGDRVAVARTLPEADNSAEWPDDEVILLAHLLGDGCTLPRHAVQYTTADPANADAVETAAANLFGITARRVRVDTEDGGGHWQVYLPSPARLGRGRNSPIKDWLEKLDARGKRSWQKAVPSELFRLPNRQVSLFLRHLWATDGSVSVSPSGGLRLYYGTTSLELARQVQSLLLRFDITSRLRLTTKRVYRQGYTVDVSGRDNQLAFADQIGVHGSRGALLLSKKQSWGGKATHLNVDTIPIGVWEHIRHKAMPSAGVTTRALASILDMSYSGSGLYKSCPSRERLSRMVVSLGDPWLESLATSDVLWDEVSGISSAGEEEVFDAHVPGTHSFLANGVVSHNSGAIEQDADVVMFIYRDDVYNPDSSDRGVAEILVAKHRNGPTGLAKLSFISNFARFGDLANT